MVVEFGLLGFWRHFLAWLALQATRVIKVDSPSMITGFGGINFH